MIDKNLMHFEFKEKEKWKEKDEEKEENIEEEMIQGGMLGMKAQLEVDKTMEEEKIFRKEEFKMNLVKSGQENLGLDKKNFTVHKILKEVKVMKDRRQHIKPLMKQKEKEEEREFCLMEEREKKYFLKREGYMDMKIWDGLGIKIEIG
jgi:hypothetical protein